jgi:hypothetical protein
MSSTVFLGLQGVVHYLTAGTRATWAATPTNGVYVGAAPGSLSPINAIRNVTLGVNAGKADVSSRASVWKLGAPALLDSSIEFEIPWNPSDAGFTKLLQTFYSRGSVALAVLDGPAATSGSQGTWADYFVEEFSREEPLDKEMVAKVKVSPTASAVAPEWVQVP